MLLNWKLVGYDRDTEKLVEKHPIPPKFVDYAKGVARLKFNDPEAVADVPLDSGQARDIAGAIGASIDVSRREYFLEPYREKAKFSEHA
jgi:hypothetical protein